jgi:hypothetical protein
MTPSFPACLIAAAGAIFLLLGSLHLAITFRGPSMLPRDRELRARMEAVAPVISRETTMWRAWLGFNASHGLGAMSFGAAYLDLALARPALLAQDLVLQGLGAAFILAMLALALRYWFRVPATGIALAGLLYAAGLAGLHGAFGA